MQSRDFGKKLSSRGTGQPIRLPIELDARSAIFAGGLAVERVVLWMILGRADIKEGQDRRPGDFRCCSSQLGSLAIYRATLCILPNWILGIVMCTLLNCELSSHANAR
eukprot:COSAG02_NODE_1495_length_12314_cov_33.691691_9_plen_108_part_00